MESIGKSAFWSARIHNIFIKCTTPPNFYSNTDYTFSQAVYNHTSLYVPVGCWDDYAFSSNWTQFINIREIAFTEEQLSTQQAYTMMNANTFEYSVYDPVNNCIGTISSVGVDENNPNHNWQVINVNGSRCLYNIGAKKFVKSANGSLVLSSAATPIEMENGDNGIIIGAQTSKQWALVNNERMNVEQAVINGIDEIPTDLQERNILYDLNGRRVQHPTKGIYKERQKDAGEIGK